MILTVFFEPAVLFSATTFFAGWNIGRVLVVTSFAVKTVITMTLLKVLDSVMKIIGEAVAVLVIYMAHVCGDSVIFHEALFGCVFRSVRDVCFFVCSGNCEHDTSTLSSCVLR